MLIWVFDPRPTPTFVDGALFDDDASMAGVMQRTGIAYLPLEERAHYSRQGFGGGVIMTPDGCCPFGIDTGASGELPWLYWTAYVTPDGPAPSGYLQLQSDTSRRGVQVGMSPVAPPARVELQGEPLNGGWVLRGKVRIGSSGGWSPLKFMGTLTNARVRVVAASCTRLEYSF